MSRTLDRRELGDFPLPPVADGDKHEHGRLVVIAGSRLVPGAAFLTGLAGLRAGAGNVRLAVPECVAIGLALHLPEVLVVPLGRLASDGDAPDAIATIREILGTADAVVAGPGLDKGEVNRAIAEAILDSGVRPALDAAVLRALAPLAGRCRSAAAPPILLPHRGELADLLECSEEEIDADPQAAALRAARTYGAFVLAKGATSHVAAPDGRCWTYCGGVPGLGISGSGDVLAGIAGSLLARGAEPLTALLWAVLLHGEAGQSLSEKIGPVGFLAREIPDEIPALLAL